jgi:hypothetical protein
MVRGERYGDYGEFFPSRWAGTGNSVPSNGERSVLLISKIFENNHHFCAPFVLFFIFLLGLVTFYSLFTQKICIQKTKNLIITAFGIFSRGFPVP